MRPVEFWTHVQRGQPSECWLWFGPKTNRGYGTFRGTTAHRVAYEREVGPIPQGHYVLHRCDNPRCVNPGHLFTGTQKENIADMFRKGRQGDCRVLGERNGRSTISRELVASARRLREQGLSQQAIADHLSISQSHVGRIVRCQARLDA